MKDERDWKKLVSFAGIASTARNILRLSLSLHIAFFATYVENLMRIESDNLLEEVKSHSPLEAEQRCISIYLYNFEFIFIYLFMYFFFH